MRKLLYIFSVSLLLIGCGSEEVEPIIDPNNYPTVDFTLENPEVEGSTLGLQDTIVVNITMDKPVDYPVTFTAAQVGGNAVKGEHYFVDDVTIPAYNTQGTMTIITGESLPGEPITADLEIRGAGDFGQSLLHPDSEILNLTFGVEGDYLAFEFGFGASEITLADGTVTTPCEAGVDIDVYFASAEGFDETDPLATAFADYQAATANCPESFVVDPSVYPDGEYVFIADLYANPLMGTEATGSLAMTTTVVTPGVSTTTIDQDTGEAFGVESTPASAYPILARVSIEDGQVSLVN